MDHGARQQARLSLLQQLRDRYVPPRTHAYPPSSPPAPADSSRRCCRAERSAPSPAPTSQRPLAPTSSKITGSGTNGGTYGGRCRRQRGESRCLGRTGGSSYRSSAAPTLISRVVIRFCGSYCSMRLIRSCVGGGEEAYDGVGGDVVGEVEHVHTEMLDAVDDVEST